MEGGRGHDVLIGGTGTVSILAAEIVGRGSPTRMPPLAPESDRVSCPETAPSPFSSHFADVDASDAVSGSCGQVSLFTRTAVVVRGTGRADTLAGNYYPTRVYGRGGDDRIFGTGTRKNRFAGGRGDDRIDGGGLLLGGPGDDRLSSATANGLAVRQDGGRGDDLLRGRYGDDRLRGGRGHDRISANAGDDLVLARDGERDSISCGDGLDRVVADARDRTRGCEQVLLP
jgi:Ca2+-binding RTX toxin-like protein